MPLALKLLDIFADNAGFFLIIPTALQANLFTVFALRVQCFAQAVPVMGDEGGCGGEDMTRRAVVLLKADDLCAGKVPFKPQDVANFSSAPSIDRLVIIADTTDVAAALGQQPQPEILRHVGVLVLVHEHVAQPLLVFRQDVGVFLEQAQAFHQQIAKVHRVQVFQSLLILRIERGGAPVCEHEGFAIFYLVR